MFQLRNQRSTVQWIHWRGCHVLAQKWLGVKCQYLIAFLDGSVCFWACTSNSLKPQFQSSLLVGGVWRSKGHTLELILNEEPGGYFDVENWGPVWGSMVGSRLQFFVLAIHGANNLFLAWSSFLCRIWATYKKIKLFLGGILGWFGMLILSG